MIENLKNSLEAEMATLINMSEAELKYQGAIFSMIN